MVILEFLKALIDNFGAAIIVPIIIGIIALIFRVKPQKAFLSALYAGVSLEGISLMVGAFTPIITPLVQNMSVVMKGFVSNHPICGITILIWFGVLWSLPLPVTSH